MDEFGFKNWLRSSGIKDKVASDYVSRLRKIAREFRVDLDREYRKDGLLYLLSLFENSGDNEHMKNYSDIDLPIGKYYINAYKLALRKYRVFKTDSEKTTTGVRQ